MSFNFFHDEANWSSSVMPIPVVSSPNISFGSISREKFRAVELGSTDAFNPKQELLVELFCDTAAAP